MSLYFGILAALFAYNLLLFLSLRDRSYLYYVLFVASMAVGQAAWNGLAYEFLWPNWPAWGNIAAVAGFNATGLFGALFSRAFLDTRRAAPLLDKVIMGLAAAFAAWMALAPVIPYQANAMLTSFTGLTFSIVATATGALCLARGFSAARFFLLAWTMLLIGTAALGARNLDLIPTNFFTLYAMQIGSALEMLLLSFALAERINVLRRGKEKAEAETLTIRREMVAALQRQEHELELKVAARTGELRAVNDRLVESEKMLRNLAHHDPLTGLINRTLLDELLDHAIERARRHGTMLAALFIDLDGFKAINDTHGHAAGDDLLRAVGDRLIIGVRASDTVARLGGDEFVALLEEVSHPEDAVHVAEKLVASLAEPFAAGTRSIRISASVGVALYPGDGLEAPTLIKWADRAMYDAKLAGKNCVRLSAGLKKALMARTGNESPRD
ncbi:MAG: diguanylate cyclase [Nitrospinae bacterium]|nr:diguanylate cyclase [Nitrospinota bacterium]